MGLGPGKIEYKLAPGMRLLVYRRRRDELAVIPQRNVRGAPAIAWIHAAAVLKRSQEFMAKKGAPGSGERVPLCGGQRVDGGVFACLEHGLARCVRETPGTCPHQARPCSRN